MAKSGLQHIDVGPELTRSEWESEETHELVHGNAFPGSPVERQLFYRDDLHEWYIYDDTAWVNLQTAAMAVHDNAYHSPNFAEEAALTAHAGAEAAPVHGSTHLATAAKLVHRDAAGRAKVVDPDVDTDIDTRGARNTAIEDHRLGATHALDQPPAAHDNAKHSTNYATEAALTSHEGNADAHKGQKNSIQIDTGDLQLVNDQASPGNNKVYGTGPAGTKGWKDDPAGAGSGDMLKSVYDTDDDGVVDDSEKLEGSTKAQVQDHTPQVHGNTAHDPDMATEAALSAHEANTALGVHGSTTGAGSNSLMHRDSLGRSRINDPSYNTDIDNLQSRNAAIETHRTTAAHVADQPPAAHDNTKHSTNYAPLSFFKGYINNLVVEYVSSTSVRITAGLCIDDAAERVLTLAAARTINLTTTGADGLDTGSLGHGLWYYVYLIYNPTTTAYAGLASLSDSPTLPSGYTVKRIVGFFYTYPTTVTATGVVPFAMSSDGTYAWKPSTASNNGNAFRIFYDADPTDDGEVQEVDVSHALPPKPTCHLMGITANIQGRTAGTIAYVRCYVSGTQGQAPEHLRNWILLFTPGAAQERMDAGSPNMSLVKDRKWYFDYSGLYFLTIMTTMFSYDRTQV